MAARRFFISRAYTAGVPLSSDMRGGLHKHIVFLGKRTPRRLHGANQDAEVDVLTASIGKTADRGSPAHVIVDTR